MGRLLDHQKRISRAIEARRYDRVKKLWHFRAWALQNPERFVWEQTCYKKDWIEEVCRHYVEDSLDRSHVHAFDSQYPVQYLSFRKGAL
jgi:hypothetical protein